MGAGIPLRGVRSDGETAGMTTLAEIYPVMGLRVRMGPLTLQAVRDEDLPELVALVGSGIHPEDSMPFTVPWTHTPADEAPLAYAQYHWRTRAEFSRGRWGLQFVVRRDGVAVGSQGVATTDFLATRTGETGSWLGLAHQGRGTGTLMRQAICALLFDHLGFTEITSAAFTDNAASLAVSRKVGYRANGVNRTARLGELAHLQMLVLTPETFVRAPYPVEVEGVEAVRRLIGLDA